MHARIAAVCFLLAAWLSTGCSKTARVAAPFDAAPAFWVWHRTSALTSEEKGTLSRAGVTRLYWQIVEFRGDATDWQPYPLAPREALPDDLEVVPVIRLAPALKPLDRPEAPAQFANWLRRWSGGRMPSAVQIDYDCPAAQLDRYGAFLARLKAEAGLSSISATALAGWIDAPLFRKLEAGVEELTPMFYDLDADVPEKVLAGKAEPMVPADAVRWIGRWKTCRVAWRAGLPNFQRLTIFDAAGKSRGHLRGWTPAQVYGQDGLERLPSAGEGMVEYRASRDLTLAGTRLEAGQRLIWRAPGEGALSAAIDAAKSSGCRGAVWFTLPGPGLQAAFGARHLQALTTGSSPAPGLKFEMRDNGSAVLRNEGAGDLPFRPGQGPYHLVLEAKTAGGFRDTASGGFLGIESGVPLRFSRKISLTFPSLRVDEEIASGDSLWHRQSGNSVSWSVQEVAPHPTP